MDDEGAKRLNVLGFTTISVLGTLSLIVGLIIGVTKEPDAQRLSTVLTTVGWVLLAIAALIVVRASARDLRRWLADIFASAKRHEELAAAATALGLRSTAPGNARLDIAFPFGATVSRVAAIFAGTWRGLDVRIFDCWRPRPLLSQSGPEQWTCAILPVGRSDIEVKISRRSLATRIADLAGMPGMTFRDSEFDRAFRVEAASNHDARLLDECVRTRLLEDIPDGRMAIEIADGRLLYCRARVPLDERGALLEAAKRLRDALRESPAG